MIKTKIFRKFIITSKFPKNVKLAESMLLKNLNTEIEKRENYKRKLEAAEGDATVVTERSDSASFLEEKEEPQKNHDNKEEQS